ncbi:isoform X1 [Podarcis lilfordi]|uniref:Isoform X1 n=1 Tax=Podarcis lilfordi TaxID=74358 RepID=A0AA35P1M6_9SAUR|nr:isoform X1 [Podarcis lilfordi]
MTFVGGAMTSEGRAESGAGLVLTWRGRDGEQVGGERAGEAPPKQNRGPLAKSPPNPDPLPRERGGGRVQARPSRGGLGETPLRPPPAPMPGRSSRAQMVRGACGVLLLALLMLPLLRTACQLFSSMAASAGGPYVPGTLSAAFVTCPNQTVAKEIARAVVEKKLAACVNIVPQITSIYEWKGKIEEDSEVLLMIKTRSSRASALAEFVR